MADLIKHASASPPPWVGSIVACVLTDAVDVTSPGAATVVSVGVREGDLVQADQELLVLSTSGPPCPGVGEPPAPPGTDRTDHTRIRVRSGVSGLLARCWVRVGDRVGQRDRLASVVPEGSVQVLALFDAALAPELAPGKPAIVRIGAPARELPGRVLGTGAGLYSLGEGGTNARSPIRVIVQVPKFPLELLRLRRPAVLEVLVPLRSSPERGQTEVRP